MLVSLTYDSNVKELGALTAIIKKQAARLTDEYWKINHAQSEEEILKFLNGNDLLDFLFYDVTPADAILLLKEIRKKHKDSSLLLIADTSISPMAYLRPGIMASSLLLRPWNEQMANNIISEFIKNYLHARKEQVGARAYVIDSKEGTLSIPYEKIFFFEAREKKLYVCTGNEEYSFYETLDALVDKLPDQFIRCHRSFIVNADKIRKIMLSKNIIYLEDGFDVPLSRSYKAVLKEFGKQG